MTSRVTWQNSLSNKTSNWKIHCGSGGKKREALTRGEGEGTNTMQNGNNKRRQTFPPLPKSACHSLNHSSSPSERRREGKRERGEQKPSLWVGRYGANEKCVHGCEIFFDGHAHFLCLALSGCSSIKPANLLTSPPVTGHVRDALSPPWVDEGMG